MSSVNSDSDLDANVQPADSEQAVDSNLPEALQIPVKKVSGIFVLGLTLTMLAFEIICNTLMTVVLPMEIPEIDPVGKVTSLGILLAIGAIIGIIAGPIAGAFSDRTASRLGRRRPWILFGGIMSIVALMIMMSATSILVLGIGYVIAILSYWVSYSALYTIVPDQVPDMQKGTVSGLSSMTSPIGGLFGFIIIASVLTTWNSRYITMAVVVLALVIPFTIFMKDKPLPKECVEPFNLGKFIKSFRVSPRKHPDFFLTWLSRFLVFMGYMLFNTYMLYYLTDDIKLPDAENMYITLMIIFIIAMTVFAIVGGIVSDKLKRRKPVMIICGLLGMGALLVLTLMRSFSGAIIAEVLMGIGMGGYLASSQAMAAQVLPSKGDRAAHLGLINIANALPAAIGQIFAIPILTATGSYSTIFVIGAVFAVVGALLVSKIKTVR